MRCSSAADSVAQIKLTQGNVCWTLQPV